MKKIYIILPVYNRLALTLMFIETLKKQTYSNYVLILIDDGSTDGTAETVTQLLEKVVVIKGKGNWWWAGCLQKGYSWIKNHADKESLTLIINDDLTVANDYLEKGLNYIETHKNSFVLSAAYNQDMPNQLIDCGVIYNFKDASMKVCDLSLLNQLNCLSTRGLFMNTSDFLKTKGFRPLLLPHYFSDFEFTIRAKRKYGIELKCFEDLKVFMNTTTTGLEEENFSNLKVYFKRAFTKRNKINPYYTAVYFLIAFPSPHNLRLAGNEIKQFLRTVLSLINK